MEKLNNKKEYIYVGPAWTYANYFLHIGHLCAYMSGDVIARYYRKKGAEVCLSSGTDCHGTAITKRARDEGKNPFQIAEFYHENFDKIFKEIDYSFDFYTKTTTEYHKACVQDLVVKMYKNGYIYERTAPMAFCPKCNKFISDREVVLTCSQCGNQCKGDSCDCGHVPTDEELIGGVCEFCKTPAAPKDNTNLVIAYSKLLPKLESYIEKYSKNWRPNAIGETLKYIKYLKEEGKNADKVITRDIPWGVEVPSVFKGYESKRIYVWLEAVLGYYTSCKKWCEENGKDFNAFFESDSAKSFYCHGKDNITFHTVLYPCILLAAGVKTLPTHIVSTEYMTNTGGSKVSKSAGGKLATVKEMVDFIGSDTIRYYFISRGPEKKDSPYSEEDLVAVHNGEIVNKLGNFIQRTLKFKGLTKTPAGKMDADAKKQIQQTYKAVAKDIENIEFRNALKSAMNLVEYANQYYDAQKPWELAKNDTNKFNDVIYTCCNLALNIANIIELFMPKCAAKIKDYLQSSPTDWEYAELKDSVELVAIEPLFVRK